MGEPIPVTDMLIHRVTLLPHLGLNLAMEIGKKTGEHKVAIRMKDKFKLTKKPFEYLISCITNLMDKVNAQILAGRIMRKCHVDEVPTLVVSLAAQCMEGI